MDITQAPRFKPFIAVTMGYALLLSLVWTWLGLVYIGSLIDVVSPFLPNSVVLEQVEYQVRFVARSETGRTGQAGINGLTMAFGIVIATAVLLAIPRLKLRTRLALIVIASLTAFVAEAIGIRLLARELASIVNSSSEPQGFDRIEGMLSYIRLLVPSVAWVPPLISYMRLSRHRSTVAKRKVS